LVAVVAGALVLPGCQGFRHFWAGLKNEDLAGRPAPPLNSIAWIAPDGTRTTTGPEAEWRVVAFFLPQ